VKSYWNTRNTLSGRKKLLSKLKEKKLTSEFKILVAQVRGESNW